jgi:hypothetical protein
MSFVPLLVLLLLPLAYVGWRTGWLARPGGRILLIAVAGAVIAVSVAASTTPTPGG